MSSRSDMRLETRKRMDVSIRRVVFAQNKVASHLIIKKWQQKQLIKHFNLLDVVANQ